MEIWMKHNCVLEVNQAKILVPEILEVDCSLICLMDLTERKDNGRLSVLCLLAPADVEMVNLECTPGLVSTDSGLNKLWASCESKYTNIQ